MASKGAALENTSLAWLDALARLENNSVKQQGAVLQVAAQQMLGRLEGSYKRLLDSDGAEYRYTAQQLQARIEQVATATGDLLSPKQRSAILKQMDADMRKAQSMGHQSEIDLEKILDEKSKTTKQSAKVNVPALQQAGKRLGDFWEKENTSFRDRVRALTQTAAAQGMSWRKMSGQVRELLLLEQKQGTESKRSTAVNKKLGIANRADLIARTELQTAFVHAQIDQARKNGYDWGRWSASGERTCGYCISRHGMIYDLIDLENSIPAHPRCRCTVIPVLPPEGYKKGQQITPEQAATELDDVFWAQARQNQIKEWKRDQNTNRNGEKKPAEFLKSNSELDQAIRRYLNTPTNTQKYLFPDSDATPPLWQPSGTTIPDPAASAQAAADAAAKPPEKAATVEATEIPPEITAAGLEGPWVDMKDNPAGQKQLLDAAKAKLDEKAKKAAAKKEADKKKKAAEDAALKAEQVKKDTIKQLQSLGVSKAGAEKVWDLAQKYKAQGLSAEAAITKAVADMANPQQAKGELAKTVTERVKDKQIIQTKGNGQVTKQSIGEIFDIAASQPGQAGNNFKALMGFAERYNISAIYGTGGKGKTSKFAKDSQQVLSSMQTAHARKDAPLSVFTGLARKQLIAHQKGENPVNTKQIDQTLDVKGTLGVGGSTTQGTGIVKVRLDSSSKNLDADTFRVMQKSVIEKIEKAGAGDVSHHGAKGKVSEYWKKSGKYQVLTDDTDWFGTFIHEMGHQVHYAAGLPRFKGKYQPSKYGKTNDREWFAETFLQYTIAPEALKKNAPDAYKFVDKVVKAVTSPNLKPGHYNRAKVDVDEFFNGDQPIPGAKAQPAPAPAPKAKPKPKKTTPKKTEPAPKTLADLKAQAEALGITGYDGMTRKQLEQVINLKESSPIPKAAIEPPPKLQPDGFKSDGTLVLKGEVFNPGATLAGSTKPRLYDSANGNQKVVKTGGAAGQNAAEHAAQRVYGRIDPNNSLNSRLIDGKLVNDFIPNGQTAGQMSAADLKKHGVRKHLLQQTAADALLANWDVKGLANDNVMVTAEGRVIKIDAGGTFDYRAQGAKKKYGAIPDELFSLRTGNGQLAGDWKTAVDIDYKRLYLDGVDGIAKKAALLKKDVAGLPADVQQAFSDRLDVYKGIAEWATAKKLPNGKSIVQSVIDGEMSWADFDFAVGEAFKKLNNKTIAKGGYQKATEAAIGLELSDLAAKKAPPPPPPKAKPKAKDKNLFEEMFGDQGWPDYKKPSGIDELMAFDAPNFKYMNKDQIYEWLGVANTVLKSPSTGTYEHNSIYSKSLEGLDQIKFYQGGGKPTIAPVGQTPPAQKAFKQEWEIVKKYVDKTMTKEKWDAKPTKAQLLVLKTAYKKQKDARAKLLDADWPGFKKPKDTAEFLGYSLTELNKMSTGQLEVMKKMGNQKLFEKNTAQMQKAIAAMTTQVQSILNNKLATVQAKTGVKPVQKTPTIAQLEGSTIKAMTTDKQKDFASKWLNANQQKTLPNIPTSSKVFGNVINMAINNEKAFYDGQALLGNHLKTLSVAQKKQLAKDAGVSIPPKATAAEIEKAIYIAEYLGFDYNALKNIKLYPSDVINTIAPGTINKTAPAGQATTATNATPVGATPPGYIKPSDGTFKPGKTSIADQEKIRGTSTHESPIWNTSLSSYLDNPQNAQVIKNVQDALKKAGHPSDALTVEQTLKAIVNYTGGGYRGQKAALMEINRPDLYKGLPGAHKNQGDAQALARANLVENIIEALPLYRGTPVIRGMQFGTRKQRADFLKKYANGDGIGSMDSYSSKAHTAEGFDSGGNGLMMHISDPQGAASVKGMSQLAGENEVLFPKHTRFRIAKMSWDRDGKFPVDPDQLADTDANHRQLHVWLEEI